MSEPTIKCITLWQPYASLIAIGAKRIETRSWSTNYRGPLLIHAAKCWNDEIADDCLRAKTVLEKYRYSPSGLWGDAASLMWKQTLGKVLARGRLAECVPMLVAPDGTMDSDFGWFGPGRFGWRIADVVPILPPIAVRGAQGLFDVPLSVIENASEEFRCR